MYSLTDEERERYHRQIILPGWGEEGQEKVTQASVFVAGAGGLGSPVSIYLAAAGVIGSLEALEVLKYLTGKGG